MPDELRGLPFRIGIAADLVERTFARLIHEPWGTSVNEWAPAIDVYETEQEFLITVEAPGVPVESVAIRADGTLLTISGERRSAQVSQSGRVVKLERTWGHFTRTVPLSCAVALSQLELRSEEGILHIRVPKVATSPSAAARPAPRGT